MADEIKVNFQAKDPRGIKLLNELYNCHLVLNDIGVRLNDQNEKKQAITVPTKDDVTALNKTFGQAVQTFTTITEKYADVNNFANNFGGTTKAFARKLITELVDFNNGIADIGQTKGGLAAYDDTKLNNWVNRLMSEIVATNTVFNQLISGQQNKKEDK